MTHYIGSGRTRPFWLPAPQVRAPRLSEDLEVEVCVVGAGFPGLCAAYALAREGRSVAVLEARSIPGAESCRSTAHLASALDDRYHRLERIHGEETARLAAASHAAAIDFIEEAAREERLDCGFRRLNGWLFSHDGDIARLQEEASAARRAGLEAELVAEPPLAGYPWGPGVRFARQAEVDPARFLAGLAEAARRRGARLFADSPVVEIEGGLPAFVRTAAGPAVRCRSIIVATNAPINDRLALCGRLAAYRTYAVACKAPSGTPRGLYWDTADPYHYARLAEHGGQEWLLVGGEDHKTGQAEDSAQRWGRLEAWAQARFPGLGPAGARWSGQVQEPADGLAYIGPHPTDAENVFVCTGDSGNGTTHGALAGLLLADLTAGRGSPWAAVYAPSRLRLGSAPRLAGEGLNAAAQYLRYFGPGDAAASAEVAPGGGAVIDGPGGKTAVHRDREGKVTRLSAVCPHFGGVVRWNGAEGSWDCPVHGSRFTSEEGLPLCGPAARPLDAEVRPAPRRRSRRRRRKVTKPS